MAFSKSEIPQREHLHRAALLDRKVLRPCTNGANKLWKLAQFAPSRNSRSKTVGLPCYLEKTLSEPTICREIVLPGMPQISRSYSGH